MALISLMEIEAIENEEEGMHVLRNQHLGDAHTIGLDDIKEILRLKYYQMRNELTSDIKKKDMCIKYCNLMRELNHILREIKHLIDSQEYKHEFQGLYWQSNKFNRKNVKKLEELIGIKKFPIVTIGDVKTGKSSIINLLIGVKLMPVSQQDCTKMNCEVRNSKEKKVTFIMDENDETKNRVIELSENTMAEITEIVSRGDTNKFTKAVFEYPVEFIDEHTCLVDTPGVKYSDALGNISFDFLNEDTAAFIFVLNVNSSGELDMMSTHLIQIARDRLNKDSVYFLSNDFTLDQSLHQKDKAIFIFNNWDEVKRNNKNNKNNENSIRERVVKHIQRLWDESATEGTQIFFMSSKQAQSWVNVGVFPRELINLQQSIDNLVVKLYMRHFQNCLCLLNSILEYMEKITLQKINFNVDNKYSNLITKTHIKTSCELLENLLTNSTTRKTKINTVIQRHIDAMVSSLTKHLKSQEVEDNIVDAFRAVEKGMECYSQSEVKSINKESIVTNKGKKLTADLKFDILQNSIEIQMFVELKKWDEKSNEIEGFASLIMKEFEKELRKMSNEIYMKYIYIFKEFLKSSWAYDCEKRVKKSTVKKSVRSKVEKGLIFASLVILFPVVMIAGFMAGPIIINSFIRDRKRQSKLESADFEYFVGIIKNTLKEITEDYVRNYFFSGLILRCNKHIDSFDDFIKDELNVKRQLINDIDTETRSMASILSSLNNLLRVIEKCYGEYHILRIKYLPDITLMVKSAMYLREVETKPEVIEEISMCRRSVVFRSRSNVLFKMYSDRFINQYARFQMQEIQILSNWGLEFLLAVKHYCYLESEKKVLLVLDNVDCNLQKYLENNPHMIPSLSNRESPKWKMAFSFIIDISKQLCKCLHIIHGFDVRMVHPDLRIDTVLVKKTEDPNKVNIFICDLCSNLPKERTNPNTDVLGGHIKENIYHMGIFLYKIAYFEVEDTSLDNFDKIHTNMGIYIKSVDTQNSDFVIDWNNEKHINIPEEYNDLIKRCLSINPEDRPSAKECLDILSTIAV